MFIKKFTDKVTFYKQKLPRGINSKEYCIYHNPNNISEVHCFIKDRRILFDFQFNEIKCILNKNNWNLFSIKLTS